MEEAAGSWLTLRNQSITSKEKFVIDGRKLILTNIERHVWKDLTKADLIQYYLSVSDFILPFLLDRPLALNISLYNPQESFFIRGMEGNAPKWASIYESDRKHKKPGKSDKIQWLICNDLATLVYIINLNSIDIHPWTSRRQNINCPDFIVIDLDPSDDDLTKVIKTAIATKKFLDSFGLTGFVKTSGKSGMHILVPVCGIQYGQSRLIAEKICRQVHELVPEITTTSVSVNSRGDKLYIDPSQNDYGDRLAAPYCVRANHLPTVSTPIEWNEIRKGFKPEKFTLYTIMDRLEKKGDLWKDILNETLALTNGKLLLDQLSA